MVNVPTRLQSLLTLELHERGGRARAELSIDDADIEAPVTQSDLQLPDLLDAQAERAAGRHSLRARRHADLRTRRRAGGPHLFAHRHHRDDPVAVVDYHDVI